MIIYLKQDSMAAAVRWHGDALRPDAQRRRGASVAVRQQWLPPESQ